MFGEGFAQLLGRHRLREVTVPSQGGRDKLSGVSFIRALISFVRTPPS